MNERCKELIVHVTVPGRPVPWQIVTGTVKRRRQRALAAAAITGAAAGKSYDQWKTYVQENAMMVMIGMKPIDYPVVIDTFFYMKPAAGRQQTPDADNLRKGFIDALQGPMIVDDILVVGGLLWRDVHPDVNECAVANVYALADPAYHAALTPRRRLLRPLDRHGPRPP